MAHWLLKTEPSTYAYDDLVKDKKTTWDGVSNALAQKHMRAMQKGDEAFIYHTGDERAVVGIAKLASDPRPVDGDSKDVVVDLTPVKKLGQPVSLATLKADPRFKDFELVRMGRLSVMPVPSATWDAILKLSASS